MDIKDLLKIEDAIVKQAQNFVLRTIERNIETFNLESTKKQIKREIGSEMIKYIRKSLKLGVDWLND